MMVICSLSKKVANPTFLLKEQKVEKRYGFRKSSLKDLCDNVSCKIIRSQHPLQIQ